MTMARQIKTKAVPIEAINSTRPTLESIESAFSVDTPTIVLKDDEASKVLLDAFGEMIAMYRTALWAIAQSKDGANAHLAKKAIQEASLVERKAIKLSMGIINAENARARK